MEGLECMEHLGFIFFYPTKFLSEPIYQRISSYSKRKSSEAFLLTLQYFTHLVVFYRVKMLLFSKHLTCMKILRVWVIRPPALIKF